MSNDLVSAALEGDIGLVKKLLRSNYSKKHKITLSELKSVFKKGHFDTGKLLIYRLSDCTREDLLCRAAENGKLDLVKTLVGGINGESDININYKEGSAIRWAARNGHIDIVKLLIDKGAHVRCNEDYALRWACSEGHVEVVECLIDLCPSKHTYTKSLGYAVENGHNQIVKMLLEHNASVDAKIIVIAVKFGNVEAIRMFGDELLEFSEFTGSLIADALRNQHFEVFYYLIGTLKVSNWINIFTIALQVSNIEVLQTILNIAPELIERIKEFIDYISRTRIPGLLQFLSELGVELDEKELLFYICRYNNIRMLNEFFEYPRHIGDRSVMFRVLRVNRTLCIVESLLKLAYKGDSILDYYTKTYLDYCAYMNTVWKMEPEDYIDIDYKMFLLSIEDDNFKLFKELRPNFLDRYDEWIMLPKDNSTIGQMESSTDKIRYKSSRQKGKTLQELCAL